MEEKKLRPDVPCLYHMVRVFLARQDFNAALACADRMLTHDVWDPISSDKASTSPHIRMTLENIRRFALKLKRTDILTVVRLWQKLWQWPILSAGGNWSGWSATCIGLYTTLRSRSTRAWKGYLGVKYRNVIRCTHISCKLLSTSEESISSEYKHPCTSRKKNQHLWAKLHGKEEGAWFFLDSISCRRPL